MLKSITRSALLGAFAALAIVLLLRDFAANSSQVEVIEAADARLAHAEGPVSYSDAVKAAAPAVVNVNTEKVVTVRNHPFFNDPLFRQFFGDMIVGGGENRKRVENSLGSGVIISPQGYILTNNHVIEGADAIQVSLQDGRTARARVIGVDPETDIAVLKIDLDDLPVIHLGDSDRLEIGDVVLAIGNPFGVGQTVTMGIVSATGRSQLGINTFENFIQTDAAINPGNSGGALVDAHGNLIGINTAIFSRSGGYQGIGFAIPTSMARNVMEQIIEHGRAVRGWIGFEGHALNEHLAESLGLDISEGVIITGIVRNSPAHKAGLEPGDIIVGVDERAVKDGREALLAITAKRPGDTVDLRVIRDNRQMTVTTTTMARPARTIGELQ